MDVLWPADRPAAPGQNVATLVSRLRAVLGPISSRVAGRDTGWPPARASSSTWTRRPASATRPKASWPPPPRWPWPRPSAAHELLSAGTAIGDEPYANWADPARERVRELLRRVRLVAAEAALATGDPRLAAGYAEAAMAADPLDEAAHRWYMSASAAAGEQAKALAAYAALQRRLGDELGVDPAPQTRELHLAILREQDDRRRRHGGRAGHGHRRPAAGHQPADGGLTKPGGTALAGRDGEIGALREAWGAAVAAAARAGHDRR